jgi:NAD(P)H-hydrate epimerase
MTFAKLEDFSTDALLHLKIVQKLGIPLHFFTDVTCQIQEITAVLANSDWIVDALFGTGLSGPVRTPMDRVIELINASGKRVLAVDIPSGLDCDTGEPLGATIRAEHTVTFVAAKLGFRNPASQQFTGHVHVVDIGIGTQFGPLQPK